MNKYVFGSRYGMDIIDLDQAHPRFLAAMNVLAHSIFRKGRIVLVCENPKYYHQVDSLARKCSFHSMAEYEGSSKISDKRYSSAYLSGEQMPDVWVFLGVNGPTGVENSQLLNLCNMTFGLSIGFVDTDVNPTACTYRIPANDDSDECIAYYLEVIEKIYEKANGAREDYDLEQKKKALYAFYNRDEPKEEEKIEVKEDQPQDVEAKEETKRPK